MCTSAFCSRRRGLNKSRPAQGPWLATPAPVSDLSFNDNALNSFFLGIDCMWCSAAINLLKEWRTWCNHGNTCRFLPEGPRSCPTVPRSPEWLQWAFYTQATNVVGGQLDLLRNHDSSPKDCASQRGCGGSPKLQANLQSCLHAFSASNIKHAGKRVLKSYSTAGNRHAFR